LDHPEVPASALGRWRVNNWEWLVPVIILLIWIVNHFLRGSEEDRPANRLRPGERPRRATSEKDRLPGEGHRPRPQAAPAPAGPPRRRAPRARATPRTRPPLAGPAAPGESAAGAHPTCGAATVGTPPGAATHGGTRPGRRSRARAGTCPCFSSRPSAPTTPAG